MFCSSPLESLENVLVRQDGFLYDHFGHIFCLLFYVYLVLSLIVLLAAFSIEKAKWEKDLFYVCK